MSRSRGVVRSAWKVPGCVGLPGHQSGSPPDPEETRCILSSRLGSRRGSIMGFLPHSCGGGLHPARPAQPSWLYVVAMTLTEATAPGPFTVVPMSKSSTILTSEEGGVGVAPSSVK